MSSEKKVKGKGMSRAQFFGLIGKIGLLPVFLSVPLAASDSEDIEHKGSKLLKEPNPTVPKGDNKTVWYWGTRS